jgi:hypothetical protein
MVNSIEIEVNGNRMVNSSEVNGNSIVNMTEVEGNSRVNLINVRGTAYGFLDRGQGEHHVKF